MRIQEAIAHLLVKQPFYGYVAASVPPVESTNVSRAGISATAELKLLYNKSWFEALTDEEALGTVMHEILHLILLHPYRKGSRETNPWEAACDMAVNENIDMVLLPPNSITVDKIAQEFKEEISHGKSAEFYYDIITGGENRLSLFDTDSEIRIVLKSGIELKTNKSLETDTSEVGRNAVKSMLSEIMDQAQAEGEVPEMAGSAILEIYRSNRVNWRNVLKRFLTGRGKTQLCKTYKKESRRFDDMPGNKRMLGSDALLALDESGSVSYQQTVKFLSELLSLKRVTGAAISVTRFDTECTEPISLEAFMRELKREKSGGTDFRPVFKLADQMHIPLVIIFTDGDGPAPGEVNQKVLWVLTKNGKRPAEYGHSVLFED